MRLAHIPVRIPLLCASASLTLTLVVGQEVVAEVPRVQNASLRQPLQLVWPWISYLQKQDLSKLSEVSSEYKGTKLAT